jgi:excisionase family DNA binding protein
MTTDTYSTIELLTIAQVADFLKLSVPSVRRLQQRRAIPFFKVGGSVRFAKKDIVAYLEKHRVTSIGK